MLAMQTQHMLKDLVYSLDFGRQHLMGLSKLLQGMNRMKTILFLLTSCASNHIHNHGSFKYRSWHEATMTSPIKLGEPYSKGVITNRLLLRHRFTLPLHEVYIYKTHANSSSYYRNCYLIFADKTLRQMNCN